MSLDNQLEVNSQSQSPLWHLILARVRDFYREPAAIFWVYGFPLVLALALGTAFRERPVERIPVAVVVPATAQGPALEKILRALEEDSRLEVRQTSQEIAREELRSGKVSLVLQLPEGQSPVLKVEKNRPESALAQGAVESAILRSLLGEKTGAIEFSKSSPKVETVNETGGRYIDFLIPGLLGMNLMGGGLWGLGYVTVDLRVRKLLKRLIATPMRKVDFLLSLVIGRIGFLLLEIIILLGFAWLVFGVQIRGSGVTLALVILTGAMCFQAVGLLVASRAASYEAVSGLMNLVMLPMYVLSGVFFSSDRFPEFLQPLIKALPLTALNESLRGVINEGASLAQTLPNLGILVGWTTIAFFFALKLFKWR